MTYRETFNKLSVDLQALDPNEPTIVTYDSKSHDLQFNQLGKVIVASYLRPFFTTKRKFKIGVLNQTGLNKLRYELQKLLSNNLLDDNEYVPDICELGTDWYRFYGKNMNGGPVRAINLVYCNITNPILVWYLCNHYNDNTRTIYKVWKSEK